MLNDLADELLQASTPDNNCLPFTFISQKEFFLLSDCAYNLEEIEKHISNSGECATGTLRLIHNAIEKVHDSLNMRIGAYCSTESIEQDREIDEKAGVR